MPLLLVEIGKRGAQGRTTGLDDRTVEANGWPLVREGCRMLELAPEDNALRVLDESINAPIVDAH